MSHYWDIRKNKALNYLPPPPPPAERGGLRDSDTQLLRSRAWMERYHKEKRDAEERRKNAKLKHADAPSAGSEDAEGGEAPAPAGRGDPED